MNYRRLVSTRFLVVLLPGVVAWMVAAILSTTRWPMPNLHDDFGNLLIGETLAMGRISNPTPAAWESLQTFHVVVQPSYTAKYPIGLGLLLAIGSWLGDPAVGLWFAAAIAASSISWMLLGKFSPLWSLFGGLWVALHPTWMSGWSQEYTNGWLPMAGCALVLGGRLRLQRRPASMMDFGVRNPLWIAIGCILVLYSRPFEGGLVCGLVGASLFVDAIQKQWFTCPRFWKTAVPGTLVLVAAVACQLAINQQVTGRWSKLPYQLHEEQYGVAPVVVWKKPSAPSIETGFQEIEEYHRTWSMDAYRSAASFRGYWQLLGLRFSVLVDHWGGAMIVAMISALVTPTLRRQTIVWVGWLLVAFLGCNMVPWVIPHYVAPLIPLGMLIAIAALRHLIDRWTRAIQQSDARGATTTAGFSRGSRRKRFAIVALGMMVLLNAVGLGNIAIARMRYSPGWEHLWSERRQRIEDRLTKLGGKHLVFVSYERFPEHPLSEEWVYNHADIERTPVVWARLGDSRQNDIARSEYSDRATWVLFVGEESEQLAPWADYAR